jgi:hypothetical protein
MSNLGYFIKETSLLTYINSLVLCPPVLSSVPDRVPEMDENWTFDVYSSFNAKGGAQDRFVLHGAFLNQSLRLELCFEIRIVLEVLHTFGGWSICWRQDVRKAG